MTTNVSENLPEKAPNSPLWIGVALIVLGIIGIVLPNFSTLVVEAWIALMLVTAGGAKFAYAFQTRERGGFIWKILLSVLYVLTGALLFFNPFNGILTLTLFLGAFLLTEGTFELILAFRLRPEHNWTWALINGLVTIAIGLLIWFQWPFNAPWLLGTFVGASVLVTGISRVMMSLNGRSISGMPDRDPSATGA
ncbi:HdeD family acid-resistance protein [Pannus brasiliensis CCIBt3594]|uniref:HdeD family acid-resistance protein n=1 Tax=Pannus brasiliensis CCIBt3594 TaxID=1427578 RepID=A0AAW9QDI7_9CHRO